MRLRIRALGPAAGASDWVRPGGQQGVAGDTPSRPGVRADGRRAERCASGGAADAARGVYGRDAAAIIGRISMSDPLRHTDRVDGLAPAERDARIEQLLLGGLDCYLAGDYEHAINLWTRVLFLDRQHDRARAYIERARSAQAERQREGDALLDQGLSAFADGDTDRARGLLRDALASGAAQEVALGVLARIERLDSGVAPRSAVPERRARPADTFARPQRPAMGVGRPAAPGLSPARWGVVLSMAAVGAVTAAAVAAWGVDVLDPATWPRVVVAPAEEPATAVPVAAAPLPVPLPTEAALARARRHFAAGRVRDAARELEAVPIGDPLRPDADRLRARIQRELLAAAAVVEPPPRPPVRAPDE
ncbi:MAG: hypothetical protein AB1635_01820 [Acidobacteriota bacterium]